MFSDLAYKVNYHDTNKLIRAGGVDKKMHFHYWLTIPKKKPLPLQKVMHTRKRHMELFQELNQKFQTLDRFRDIPNMGSMVSNRKPGGVGGGQPAKASHTSGARQITCKLCK